MPFRKISADEAHNRVKERDGIEGDGGINQDRGVILRAQKAPPSWNENARSARFIMSSESVDRYGDIVVQQGIDITRFMENPQGLLFHNSRSWPIGTWSDVSMVRGRPKRTEGTLNFMEEGEDEDADRAVRHVRAGTIRTVSIGFRPDWDEIELILDENEDYVTGFKYNKSELLECSLVPIPAQPDALVKDAGGDMRLAREIVEDILDNWARTPAGLLVPREQYESEYANQFGLKTFAYGLNVPKSDYDLDHDRRMIADDDVAAVKLVGMSVQLDSLDERNSNDEQLADILDETGTVLASYICETDNGKIHALWVEYTNNNDALLLRGIESDRFIFLSERDHEEDDSGEDENESVKDEELEDSFIKKIFPDFEEGDRIETRSATEVDEDGTIKITDSSFVLLRNGEVMYSVLFDEIDKEIEAESDQEIEADNTDDKDKSPEKDAELTVADIESVVDKLFNRIKSLLPSFRSARQEQETANEESIDSNKPDDKTVEEVRSKASDVLNRLKEQGRI